MQPEVGAEWPGPLAGRRREQGVRELLAAELDASDAVCSRLDLEELFIETVGGQAG